MKSLGRIRIGTTARALAAALAIGGALVSLTAGPTAYAAKVIPTEAGDSAIGDGDTNTGGGAGTITAPKRKPKPRPQDDGTRCTETQPNGHIDFYLPGDVISDSHGRPIVCNPNGSWVPPGNAPRNAGASRDVTTLEWQSGARWQAP